LRKSAARTSVAATGAWWANGLGPPPPETPAATHMQIAADEKRAPRGPAARDLAKFFAPQLVLHLTQMIL